MKATRIRDQNMRVYFLLNLPCCFNIIDDFKMNEFKNKQINKTNQKTAKNIIQPQTHIHIHTPQAQTKTKTKNDENIYRQKRKKD